MENKNFIADIYGGKAFLKVYPALEILKVKFSFVNKDNTKEHIDVYMDADIFHCDLIPLIRSGELRERGNKERIRKKNSEDKYCKAIWVSPPSVSTDDVVKCFEIQPGEKTEFVFRATMGKISIIVGCDYRFLLLMAEHWRFLESDYEECMRKIYNMESMKNSYFSERQEPAKPEPQVATAPVVQTSNDGFSGIPQNAKPVTVKEEIKEYRMKVSIPLTPMGTDKKAMKAVTEDNHEYPLVFTDDSFNKAEWKNFEARCSRPGAVIKVEGVFKDDRIYVKKFA